MDSDGFFDVMDGQYEIKFSDVLDEIITVGVDPDITVTVCLKTQSVKNNRNCQRASCP